MFCKNCGKTIEDDSLFCPHCGTAVKSGNAGTDSQNETLYDQVIEYDAPEETVVLSESNKPSFIKSRDRKVMRVQITGAIILRLREIIMLRKIITLRAIIRKVTRQSILSKTVATTHRTATGRPIVPAHRTATGRPIVPAHRTATGRPTVPAVRMSMGG